MIHRPSLQVAKVLALYIWWILHKHTLRKCQTIACYTVLKSKYSYATAHTPRDSPAEFSIDPRWNRPRIYRRSECSHRSIHSHCNRVLEWRHFPDYDNAFSCVGWALVAPSTLFPVIICHISVLAYARRENHQQKLIALLHKLDPPPVDIYALSVHLLLIFFSVKIKSVLYII